MALRIERSDDLSAAEEIKQLFVRNGRSTFPEQFDLVYPEGRASGGASWIARDEAGKVVGHIAAIPRQLRDKRRTYRAFVMADMMFDEEYRNFFAPAQLARAAVGYLRKSGAADFAYAAAIELASGVLKAGGLKVQGRMQRYVRPLNPLYQLYVKVRRRPRRYQVETFSVGWEERVPAVLGALSPDSHVRGDRPLSRYEVHLGRESIQVWDWFVVRPRGRSKGIPVALVLGSRDEEQPQVMTIRDLIWDEARTSAGEVLHAVSAAARRRGYNRISIHALAPSRLVEELLKAGFLERADHISFLALECREGGMPDLQTFVPTFFDGTAW